MAINWSLNCWASQRTYIQRHTTHFSAVVVTPDLLPDLLAVMFDSND